MTDTGVGVLLALLSSITTALAHALLKAGKDKLAVRALIGAVGTSALFPFCLFVPLPTLQSNRVLKAALREAAPQC